MSQREETSTEASAFQLSALPGLSRLSRGCTPISRQAGEAGSSAACFRAGLSQVRAACRGAYAGVHAHMNGRVARFRQTGFAHRYGCNIKSQWQERLPWEASIVVSRAHRVSFSRPYCSCCPSCMQTSPRHKCFSTRGTRRAERQVHDHSQHRRPCYRRAASNCPLVE